MPVFVGIGLAMGATAGTAAAVGTATALTAASVAAQGYGMYKTNQASKASAALAGQTADFNAKVDLSEAKQVELDADANVRAARKEGEIYTSRQKAAFAASGVLNTGSPLDVEVTTAGQIEQRILQDRSNALRESSRRESSATVGRLYGQEQQKAIRRQNSVDMLRGGVGILSTVASAYQGGTFSGFGSDQAKAQGFIKSPMY